MGMLIIQMFPVGVALPAYFYTLLRIGDWTDGKVGLDTHLGLILVLAGGGVAFYAWLFKGYLDNMPRELEEAAFVDGASRLKTMWYVLFPLVRPIIAAIFLLLFIGTYSEYLLDEPHPHGQHVVDAAARAQRVHLQPVQPALDPVRSCRGHGLISLMIIFLLMQRYLVAGLARGAVKG